MWCECDEGVEVDEAEMEPEGRWVAEEAAEEEEPVRWWGTAREGVGVVVLALEEPLPVRVRAASGGVWVDDPLRPRTLLGWWEAEPLDWPCILLVR